MGIPLSWLLDTVCSDSMLRFLIQGKWRTGSAEDETDSRKSFDVRRSPCPGIARTRAPLCIGARPRSPVCDCARRNVTVRVSTPSSHAIAARPARPPTGPAACHSQKKRAGARFRPRCLTSRALIRTVAEGFWPTSGVSARPFTIVRRLARQLHSDESGQMRRHGQKDTGKKTRHCEERRVKP